MENSQLQEVLRARLENSPPKARRVVEFLLSHMREAAFLTIGDVAGELNVSKAQLVRVARMLGFGGYSELKAAIQETVLEQVNPAAMLNRALSENESALAARIHQMEHANLEDTWNRLDPANIKKFSAMLLAADSIFCAGWGISAMTSECLFSRLRELGLKSFTLQPGCLTLIEQVRCLDSRDVLIAFDLPSYALLLTESVARAKQAGAKIITVTDSPAAPICEMADLSFFVSDSSPTFGSSLIGAVFLIHVLTSALSVEMGDRARKALEEQAACLHDERIYHPVFGLRY